MNHLPWLLLALLACTDGKDPVDPVETDTETEPDTWDTAEEPPADYTGMFAHVVLLHYPVDAESEEPFYAAYGLFPEETLGAVNTALCVLAPAGDPCVSDLGAADGPATVVDASEYNATTFNAGDTISVGGVTLEAFDQGAVIYFGTPEGWDGGGDVSFDGDLAPYAGSDVFSWATQLVATAPDPLQRVAVGAEPTLDFAWTPGTSGEVYLRYNTGMLHLTDDGAYTFDLGELDLVPPVDGRIVILSRATDTSFDAAGNAAHVTTSSEQWYYVDYKNDEGYSELLEETHVAETCEAAKLLAAVPAGMYYGDLTDDEADYDLGDGNPATDYATEGEDEVLRIDLLAGQKLTAELRQPWVDGAIYLLADDCDTDDPLTGADATLFGEVEEIDYTATSDQTVLLVVDSFDTGGRAYALTLTVE